MIYLKLTSQLKLLMDLHGALVASRPPHCHRNSTDHIKSFNRSIEIFPSGSLILLILPALTQTLFGNLWAFPHHRGKVRVQKKGKRKKKKGIPCLKRSSSPGKNTDIYHLITTEENIASLNSAQSPHMIKDLWCCRKQDAKHHHTTGRFQAR